MNRMMLAGLVLLGMGLGHAAEAGPIAIRYEAANDSANPNRWTYSYYVNYDEPPFQLGADQGLAIFFDPVNYATLDIPTASAPDTAQWDPLLIQPDAILGDGYFDVLAKGPISSFPLFAVSFDWFGVGTPGAQLFELYQMDGLTPVAFATGMTSPVAPAPVPEPATLTLMTVGGGGMVARWIRRRRR